VIAITIPASTKSTIAAWVQNQIRGTDAKATVSYSAAAIRHTAAP
jgi:hypothetical protein